MQDVSGPSKREVGFRGLGLRVRSTSSLTLTHSYIKASGPKDHTIYGFWAILSLRVNISLRLGWTFGAAT